jgi:hypothetical protein
MSRWSIFGVLLLLLVVASGCDSSGAVTTPPVSDDPDSSRVSSSSTAVITSTTVVSGLRSEFLAWVAPVDGDEARLGWEAYELPGLRVYWSAQADCWEDNGFGEFAGNVRAFQPVMRPLSGRLLPDMSQYRQVGFLVDDNSAADDVVASSTDEDSLADTLSYHTDLGLRAEDVAAIHAVGLKCIRENGGYSDTMGLPDLVSQWLFRLGEVERQPELNAIVDGTVLPCLREMGPEFAEAETIDLWFSTQFGVQATMDTDPDTPRDVFERAMIDWGQGFAECMEPLVEARREPRLAAREEWVDEHFTELLQLQSDIDDFLAGN